MLATGIRPDVLEDDVRFLLQRIRLVREAASVGE